MFKKNTLWSLSLSLLLTSSNAIASHQHDYFPLGSKATLTLTSTSELAHTGKLCNSIIVPQSPVTVSLTITNTTAIPAYNITAILPTVPAEWANVTQTPAAGCATILPRKSCTLTYSYAASTTAPPSGTSILIKGDNTNSVAIVFNFPGTATIHVTNLPMSLSVTGINVLGGTSGSTKNLIVSNLGPGTTTITCPTSSSPSISTIICTGCTGLISGSSACNIAITPTSTPSSAPGDTNPSPVYLTIQGNGTNILTTPVNVLTYGSVANQSGYVFSITENSSNTSISGIMAYLSNNSFGISWDSSSTCVNANCTDTNATSLTAGSANTAAIIADLAALSLTPTSYAAGLCNSIQWYLPAICELGSRLQSANCATGTPNMQDNLVAINIGNLLGNYWSSTQQSTNAAWVQDFPSPGLPSQGAIFKGTSDSDLIQVRCVHTFQ